MKATEERNAQFHFLFSSVNQYTNPDDNATQFVNSVYNLSDGATSSQDIINNQDTVTRIDGKSTPKNSFLVFFLGEHTFYAQLPSNFKGDDNATGSWSNNYLDFVFFEMLSDELAEPFGIMGVLQNTEFFPVYW